jgi:hypothetical protein
MKTTQEMIRLTKTTTTLDMFQDLFDQIFDRQMVETERGIELLVDKDTLIGLFKREFSTAVEHRCNAEVETHGKPLVSFESVKAYIAFHTQRANVLRDIVKLISPKDYQKIMSWADNYVWELVSNE